MSCITQLRRSGGPRNGPSKPLRHNSVHPTPIVGRQVRFRPQKRAAKAGPAAMYRPMLQSRPIARARIALPPAIAYARTLTQARPSTAHS